MLYDHDYGDVREFPEMLPDGVDAVIHLAAISNDAIGNKFKRFDIDVNGRISLTFHDVSKPGPE